MIIYNAVNNATHLSTVNLFIQQMSHPTKMSMSLANDDSRVNETSVSMDYKSHCLD